MIMLYCYVYRILWIVKTEEAVANRYVDRPSFSSIKLRRSKQEHYCLLRKFLPSLYLKHMKFHVVFKIKTASTLMSDYAKDCMAQCHSKDI